MLVAVRGCLVAVAQASAVGADGQVAADSAGFAAPGHDVRHGQFARPPRAQTGGGDALLIASRVVNLVAHLG
ncbi:hypothetical protein [Streptomyces sp. HNM0575]|uniref:hypothetical protein n=1 Tax=Streptomyces sp. HNM0575 TaxID=2716338 RepID=UPI001F1095FF|nr:hypothetical protein [Streptomyces sp. HNM0575]